MTENYKQKVNLNYGATNHTYRWPYIHELISATEHTAQRNSQPIPNHHIRMMYKGQI